VPHILEAIAMNDDPQQRALARLTLSTDQTTPSARLSRQLMAPAAAAPPVTAPHRQRMIYGANHGPAFPGTLARSDGQARAAEAAGQGGGGSSPSRLGQASEGGISGLALAWHTGQRLDGWPGARRTSVGDSHWWPCGQVRNWGMT